MYRQAIVTKHQFYAEYEADRLIREAFFPDFQRTGIMVEVGGGTPDFLSMSKHFKDSGWRTVVVEPNPEFAAKHRAMGNEVYECACSFEDRDSVPFTVVSQEVEAYGGVVTDHAFSSLDLKPGYESILPPDAVLKTITVSVRRLDTILDQLGIRRIDLLSVDVEGWELEVLRGLNTKRTPCRVIVVENIHHDSAYSDYMREIDYELAMKIEYNYVFTKKRKSWFGR